MKLRRICPNCDKISDVINSGWVIINKGKGNEQKRKRYKCKRCGYHFSVKKMGKRIHNYYNVKAIQLYLEGLRINMISEMIGVSHDVIEQWIKPIKPYLDSIRLNFEKEDSYIMSEEGRIVHVVNKERFTSGVIIQGEKSEVWGVIRGVQNRQSIKTEGVKYVKDNHSVEDETYYTSKSSDNEGDEVQINPDLSDDEIMREFGQNKTI
jgi:transposase-like protein